MIGRLTGKIADKQPPLLLIDVQGVAYEVEAPMTTFYRLPEVGGDAQLYTHLVTREDMQRLFGFIQASDRELFRILIKVNGVGPKLALAILSSIEPADFVQCVRDKDTQSLVRLPGIGKKTAERLIIEVADKLGEWANEPVSDASGRFVSVATKSDHKQEAINALEALGYKRVQASRAINAIYNDEQSVEALIRRALQEMVAC